jgi:hypothetical protein
MTPIGFASYGSCDAMHPLAVQLATIRCNGAEGNTTAVSRESSNDG